MSQNDPGWLMSLAWRRQSDLWRGQSDRWRSMVRWLVGMLAVLAACVVGLAAENGRLRREVEAAHAARLRDADEFTRIARDAAAERRAAVDKFVRGE